MKFYIAGPMTGVPQFNVPLFNEVALKLRADTLEVISPAEMDSPEMQAAALASPDGDLSKLEKDTNETWGEVLARDVKVVADTVDGIVLLPNWYKSRGAKLEAFVGLLTGKQFYLYSPAGRGAITEPSRWLHTVVKSHVQDQIREYMP